MPTNTIFIRYRVSGHEYIVELVADSYNQWEVARVVRFQDGRANGESTGILSLPWTARQDLWDNYQIGL